MSTRCRVLILTVLGAVVLWLGSSLAEEDKNKAAKDLFDSGVQMFQAGQYQVAAESFREAYKLRPSWKILYNIGQAETALGRYGLALEAFQQYLAQGKEEVTVDRKNYVINEIKRLRELVGDVDVQAPDGSVIYVDGVERGTLPLIAAVLVEAGVEHEIIVVASDGKWTRKFMVWGGKSVKLKFEDKDKKALAVATPAPVAPRATPPVVPPIPSPGAGKPPIPIPSPREGEGGEESSPALSAMTTWGWVGVGVGGAALLGGAITGGMALSVASDIKAKCPDGNCPDDKKGDVDKMDTLAATSTALLVVGGAVAATGAVLLILDATSESKGSTEAASVQLAPLGAGLGLSGRFY